MSVVSCNCNIEYKFYLTIGSSESEVHPLNFLESSLIDEQEKENIFYRRKFQGALTFVNNNGSADFDLLWGIEQSEPCEELLLLIERNGDYYWDGYFSTTDGDFDIDACTFTVSLKTNDDYRDIFDNADLQHNILDVTPTVSTRAYTGPTTYIDFTRNRGLLDVIEYLADLVLPGATVSSDFFTAATNPVTLYDNFLTHLTIAQKSDIIRPDSSNPATTAMMSWNQLMNILWVMFQVKWNYDGGVFNVEHVSWFGRAAGLDLRTQLLARAMNKYSYLKEDMPKYEKFAFAEADDVNFVGVPIWYDSLCIDNDPDTNVKESLVNVTTDLDYIIDNPDAIADEGFVILCNFESGGNYYVEATEGVLDGSIKNNARLSWANLHHAYFRHERVLIEGYLNDDLVTFWTAKKTKIQRCAAIVCPADGYDPSDEITTELGETYFGGAVAVVKKSELSPSGEMNFDLVYGPEDNENTGVDDEFFCVIGAVTYPGKSDYLLRVRYTMPSPGNYNVDIEVTVYDNVGGVVGVTGWDNYTITAGTINDTFTDSLDHAIPAGGCAKMRIRYTGSEIDAFEVSAGTNACETDPVTYVIL